ncbi:hypothetical protein F0P96_05290 [Hymenobacter busanensis]|uniref:Uncharacterized protein n=1 Tax=Hymenobacter busanensis TaxID=2607656 RepID=A0A7L5A1B6_9BACT|nr:hypothetical protein [Hymenobacter busanensis]KAA9338258.1 hypothetical protein F0P96_05290 [Hymenobacter busanensis]QHJ09318.1 hypothetical protein GUY19_19320 [Hymenobacter busanensis]
MRKSFVAAWFALTLSTAPQLAAAQCAMCKTNVESGRTSEEKAYDFSGLNSGILYLMAVPYVLIGSVGYFWYRNSQLKKRQAAAR